MPRLLASLALALLVVGGCESVRNTGFVCLVPEDLQCACSSGDTSGADDCVTPELPLDEWAYGNGDPVCVGSYPADASYEVAAFLYEGGGGYSIKAKCKVSREGDRIRVKSHFWHEREQDAIVEPGATATCGVGQLSAGTWTLEYGGNSVDVEIGAEGVQSMVCVESDKQHSG